MEFDQADSYWLNTSDKEAKKAAKKAEKDKKAAEKAARKAQREEAEARKAVFTTAVVNCYVVMSRFHSSSYLGCQDHARGSGRCKSATIFP
jgi:membrane protein involved in colicin uptake